MTTTDPAPRPDPRSLDPRMIAANAWRTTITARADELRTAARQLPWPLDTITVGEIDKVTRLMDCLTVHTVATPDSPAGYVADSLRDIADGLRRIRVDARAVLPRDITIPAPPTGVGP